jgi:drug/metabolite transporter (DMT)-like permease
MALTLGIIFGLISMIGFGLSDALSQVPAKKIGIRRTIFYRNITVIILLLLAFLIFEPSYNFSLYHISFVLVLSMILYIPFVLFLKALKLGKVGVVTPVASSGVIFTVVLALIILGESLSLFQTMGIPIIIIGILLISLNFKELKNSHLFSKSSGVPYALITAVLWGIGIFLLKFPVNELGPFLTTFTLELGILVTSGLHLLLTGGKFIIPEKKYFGYVFFVGFFGAIAFLSYNLGIEIVSVSIAGVFAFSSSFVTALYGKFVYSEKMHKQQYLAILLIIAGIVMISI